MEAETNIDSLLTYLDDILDDSEELVIQPSTEEDEAMDVSENNIALEDQQSSLFGKLKIKETHASRMAEDKRLQLQTSIQECLRHHGVTAENLVVNQFVDSVLDGPSN